MGHDFTHHYAENSPDQNGRLAEYLDPEHRSFDASAGSSIRIYPRDNVKLHLAGFLWDRIGFISSFEQVEFESERVRVLQEVLDPWLHAAGTAACLTEDERSAGFTLKAFMRVVLLEPHFLWDIASEYRFVCTRKMRMGLDPILAKEGDYIAILASGNMPFVLRQVDDSYAGEEAHRIIGACYIDGMMLSDIDP